MKAVTVRFGAWCLAASLGCASPGVCEDAAASPEDEQEARELFVEAREAMSRGEFATACPLLEESVRLHEGIGTQFNLAHCWEKIGKKAAAWQLFRDVADGAKANGESKRAEVAARRALQLVASLNYVVLRLPKTSERMSVRLGGKIIPRQRWGVPLPLDPGDYALSVSADGFRSFQADVELESGSGTLEVNVPALQPLAEDAKSREAQLVAERLAETAPDDQTIDTAGTNWTTWALVGGGVVAVGGLAYGLTASGSAKEASQLADEQCPPDRTEGCTAEEVSHYNHYVGEQRAWSQRSLIGYGIAAAATLSIAGIVLFADWDEVDGRETSVALDVRSSGASASLRHTFW